MKNRIIPALMALALSGSLMAETLVTVNGKKIDSSELDFRVQNIQKHSQGQISDTPELRNQVLNDIVIEQVVTAEAKRLGLDKGSEYKAAEDGLKKQAREQGLDKQPNYKKDLAIAQNQLLMMAYAADVIKKNPVTEQQVQERYNQIKAYYQNTDEVQLGQIITDQASQAQAAIKELASKKSFADVAKKYSIEPEVKSGKVVPQYTIPLIDLKENNPRVYEAVVNLKKGEYTKTPLANDGVYVVFSVINRQPVELPNADQLKANITETLSDERVREAVSGLMNKANIVPSK